MRGAAVALICLIAGAGHAQVVEPADPAAPIVESVDPVSSVVKPSDLGLEISATLDSTTCHVGERITLTLRTILEEGEVLPPPLTLDLDPFRLRTVTARPDSTGQTFALSMVPLEAGPLEVPAIPLTIRYADGTTAETATNAVPVTVLSNLSAPSDSAETAPEPADYKPVLEAQRNWIPLLVAMVAGLLATILGFWLFRKLRERRRAPREVVTPLPKKPTRPAWEIALERLDAIVAERYVEQGELDRQYVEVTETLRGYLEHRYGVPALECTTGELNEHLAHSPLAPEVAARVLGLLREADLVKFAKANPEIGDAKSLEVRTREIVRITTPQRVEEAA